MFGHLFSETIAVVQCNNCSCSMQQLQFFVELFKEATAVVRCDYCRCLVQLLQMFDKASAVVWPNNCNRLLKQLQLFGQTTAVVRSTNCSYSCKCAYETIAVVRCKNKSCSFSCSAKSRQLFDEAAAVVWANQLQLFEELFGEKTTCFLSIVRCKTVAVWCNYCN
jgi:hypothetical protein